MLYKNNMRILHFYKQQIGKNFKMCRQQFQIYVIDKYTINMWTYYIYMCIYTYSKTTRFFVFVFFKYKTGQAVYQDKYLLVYAMNVYIRYNYITLITNINIYILMSTGNKILDVKYLPVTSTNICMYSKKTLELSILQVQS